MSVICSQLLSKPKRDFSSSVKFKEKPSFGIQTIRNPFVPPSMAQGLGVLMSGLLAPQAWIVGVGEDRSNT